MDSETEPLMLASEFPPATREAWRKLAEGVLKGKPLDALESVTADGLRIAPLYERAPDPVRVAARPGGAPWQVVQRIDLPDPAAANAEALHELENGAGGLALVFAGSVGAFGFGLPPTAEAMERALEGVYLDAGVPIDLDGGNEAVGEAIVGLLRRRGAAPAAAEIRFGLDPLGVSAARGWMPQSWDNAAPAFAGSIRALADQGLRGPFAVADARAVHAAGGSEALELAVALAVAVAYLRALEDGGVPLDDARGMIAFRLAADADQWLTAAKFRALRRLWAHVETACALDPQPAFVAAETAWRMMTRHDPYVNMLRTTVAAFAAAMGGANAVTVLPFTNALGLPDRFARRMARNAQLILLEECHLAAVSDPGLGSGALEGMTDELCRAAWALFGEIEKAGGAAAALASGMIQEKVAAVRAARAEAIATRRIVVTGVSEFPNLDETPVPVLAAEPVAGPAPPSSPAVRAQALSPMRLSEPFEALRDASDRALAARSARPKVFLATLGRPADFTARATFAKSLFEAGGIEAAIGDGFATPAETAQAFRLARTPLACLCSSDALYEREAAGAARALREAGASQVFLAGRPGAHEAAWREAGVGAFIYAGCDALAALRAAHDILGVTAGAAGRAS